MIIVTRIPGNVKKANGEAIPIGLCIVVDSLESITEFQELVHRATNLWPDATPEIKEFADRITNDGIVWQDYRSQDTSPKPKKDLSNDNPEKL